MKTMYMYRNAFHRNLIFKLKYIYTCKYSRFWIFFSIFVFSDRIKLIHSFPFIVWMSSFRNHNTTFFYIEMCLFYYASFYIWASVQLHALYFSNVLLIKLLLFFFCDMTNTRSKSALQHTVLHIYQPPFVFWQCLEYHVDVSI